MNKNIYQRILAVMNDIDYIQKSMKTVNNTYRFVSHDQVAKVMHKAFVTHGIVAPVTVKNMSQEGNRTSVTLGVKFINVDNPQDFFEVESLGYGIDSQDKGPGKAVSYAFKYALLKTFCLETGDDPDNDVEEDFKTSEEIEKEENKTYLTKEQQDLIKEKSNPARIKRMCAFYEVSDLSKIEASKFDFILSQIKPKVVA